VYKKLYHNKKTKNGFTLIELIFVVSVISILALLGLRLYAGQQDKARDAIVRGNMSTVHTAIQGVFADNQDQSLAEARDAAAECGIKNPYTNADDSGFDTPAEGALVITGADGGPFTITGYGKGGIALPDPFIANP